MLPILQGDHSSRAGRPGFNRGKNDQRAGESDQGRFKDEVVPHKFNRPSPPYVGIASERMQKIVLMSILFVLLGVPALAAGDPRPLLGIRRALWWTFLGAFGYVFAVVFVYPRFVH